MATNSMGKKLVLSIKEVIPETSHLRETFLIISLNIQLKIPMITLKNVVNGLKTKIKTNCGKRTSIYRAGNTEIEVKVMIKEERNKNLQKTEIKPKTEPVVGINRIEKRV